MVSDTKRRCFLMKIILLIMMCSNIMYAIVIAQTFTILRKG